MSAGTQPYIVEEAYDPRTITLDQFLTLYERESTEIGGRQNKTWGNKLRTNEVLKPYLDQPVINIFGAVPLGKGSQSFMTDIENAEASATLKGLVQSKIRTIENNIFPKLSVIGKQENVNLLSGFSKISEEVKKRKTRGDIATVKVQYDVNKIGVLIDNLVKHVKEFPDDKPIANAIIFNLETFSRPSLTTEIRTVHYITNKFDAAAKAMGMIGADGLLIPAGTKGVKRQAKGQTPNVQPYNAPLSKRAVTILQDQSEYNEKIIGNEKLDYFFQIKDKVTGEIRPLDLDKDVNPLLKKVTPSGILLDITDKGAKPSNKKLTSKMLRPLGLNVGKLTISEKNLAMLSNRDTAQDTGAQKVYMGSPGQYSNEAVSDLDKISKMQWGFYTLKNDKHREVYNTQNKNMLNPNTFIFGKNEKDANGKFLNDDIVYVPYQNSVAKDIPIQTGGFAPPISEEFADQNMLVDDKKTIKGFDDMTSSLQEKLQKKGLGKLAVAALTSPTAIKLAGSLAGGATTAVPVTAEAAIDVAFSPSTIGEENIDPKTGQVYRSDEMPPSTDMTEEEILKRSRMAKGQFQPDIFQQASLDRATQAARLQQQLGQSFITGSDNSNFLNMEENNAGK